MIIPAGERELIFFQGCSACKTILVPVDGPIHLNILAVSSELHGLNKKSKEHMKLRGNGGTGNRGRIWRGHDQSTFYAL